MIPPYSIYPLGDSALTVEFGNIISQEINNKVLAAASAIEGARLDGIRDIVPAYSSLTIHYNPVVLIKHNKRYVYKHLAKQVEQIITSVTGGVVGTSRTLKIPVCYSLKWGLDLEALSSDLHLTIEEIVRIHTSKMYKVYMIGFLPGFAYMGDVDDRIASPRKAEPRQKIEAGILGIAGRQTGIYPLASPGGWQIIGRTPVLLFDKEKVDPVLFKAGDQVQFYSISEDEFENY